MHFHELSTPALVIDLDIVERNLDRMANYCRQHGLGLRPHAKTHKTIEVARMQVEHGAIGLTVAKAGEAEVMAAAGAPEILVAYPVYGQEKLKKLAHIGCTQQVIVALDSKAAAEELSRAAASAGAKLGVLVEFDVGFQRCGLQPGPACLDLARTIEKLSGLRFRGLMTYFGNVWGTKEQRKQAVRKVADQVEQALLPFKKAGMTVEILSGGSTPSAEFSHEIPGLSEIRPGTYVYNDLNTYYQGACRLDDCAARVVSTVVSTAVPGRAIFDAGSKTLSSDALTSGPGTGYGYVVEVPEAKVIKLNEEHGYIDASTTRPFAVGQILTIIPNHVCTCVNMHDEVFLLRKGEVVDRWRVAARGKVR